MNICGESCASFTDRCGDTVKNEHHQCQYGSPPGDYEYPFYSSSQSVQKIVELFESGTKR